MCKLTQLDFQGKKGEDYNYMYITQEVKLYSDLLTNV